MIDLSWIKDGFENDLLLLGYNPSHTDFLCLRWKQAKIYVNKPLYALTILATYY